MIYSKIIELKITLIFVVDFIFSYSLILQALHLQGLDYTLLHT